MISALLRFLVIGVLALVGFGLAMTVLGIAIGIASLLLKLAVVVAIGYVVVRLFAPKPKQIADADRRWLES